MSAQELPQSAGACETLDVRGDMNVGGTLTVDGVPVLPGGALASDGVTLQGDGLVGTEFAIKAVQHDGTLVGNGTVASHLAVNPTLAITELDALSVNVNGGLTTMNGGGFSTFGGQIAGIPDGANLGGDTFVKGTSEFGEQAPAAIGPGNVIAWQGGVAPLTWRLWSRIFVTTNAGGANLCGLDITLMQFKVATFYNLGPGVLVVKHQSGLDVASNRVHCPGNVDLVIMPGCSFQVHGFSGLQQGFWIRAVGLPSGTLQGTGAPDALALVAPVGTYYRDNATGVNWVKYGANAFNWTPASAPCGTGWVYRDDAMNTQWLSLSHAGTGVETSTAEAGHPGILVLSVANFATPDRSRVIWNNSVGGAANIFLGGGAPSYCEGLVKFDALQDAVERWSFRSHFFDNLVAGDATNGAYFEVDLAANGNQNWFGCTASGGVRTKTDLGIAPVAGVYQRLRTEVNGPGTSVRFLINDAFVAANVANIPAGLGTNIVSQMVKTLGVTARTTKIDYIESSQVGLAR